MADYYVWSGATGTGDGSSWANAYTSLVNLRNAVAKDIIAFVAHDHVETHTVATNFGMPAGNDYGQAISVNRLGAVPPTRADFLAGATIQTTGTNTLQITDGYFHGIRFKPGHNAGTAVARLILGTNLQHPIFKDCIFDLSGSTAATTRVDIAQGATVRGYGCQIKFGGVGQKFGANIYGTVYTMEGNGKSWLEDGSVIPTTAFSLGYGMGENVVKGYNLTVFGNRSLVNAVDTQQARLRVENCMLADDYSFTQASFTGAHNTATKELIACSTPSAPYGHIYSRVSRGVTLVTDTGVKRTNGGSLEGIGQSWKFSPGYWHQRLEDAFRSPDILVWNDAVGAPKTVTFHLMTDNFALNSGNVWIEADLPGLVAPAMTAVNPDWFHNNPVTPLAASAEAWSTPGIAAPLPQKVSLTFTPQRAGLIKLRLAILVGVNPQYPPVWLCPKPEFS